MYGVENFSSPTPLTGTLLEQCCQLLGWQGGTISQVKSEVKKITVRRSVIDFKFGRLRGFINRSGCLCFTNWRGRFGQDWPTQTITDFLKKELQK